MHTEYGVGATTPILCQGLHQPETSCSCNSRSKNSRRVTSMFFLALQSS